MAVYKPTARANVTPGDVVVHDVDNDNSVITTTEASAENVAGVCAETIASGNPVVTYQVTDTGQKLLRSIESVTELLGWLES